MLRIEITRHAAERMVERNMSEAEVRQALTPPTTITQGKGEKLVAAKNGIRVVHAVKPDRIVVVTVTRS